MPWNAGGAKGAQKARALAEKLARRREKLAALTAEIAGLEASLAALAGRPAKPPAAVSPFAPAAFPALPRISGVRFASAAAGVRYSGRDDVMLVELAAGSVIAGTFTRSRTRAAPVLWCEARLAALARAAKGEAGSDTPAPLAIVANSGNANAFTGRHGQAAVEAVAAQAAAALGIPAGRVFMASTGVIGEPLPAERVSAKMAELAAGLAEDRIEAAARAIMTTDTFPKGAGAVADLGGVPVSIAGYSKGSGMIAPDMATMLAFVFTDAAIDPDLLQRTVAELTGESFNAITVDSDTSTSDTLLVGATGRAPMKPIASRRDPRYAPFRAALGGVMRDLAIQVVKDGEGASKLVEISVTGAESDAAARRIGLSVANSPLVKTAIAGEDPNWGRIVMAVGKAGEAADRDRLSIRFGDIVVAEQGWVSPGYAEEQGAAYMRRRELAIGIDVGVGTGRATVWTCDLTHRYIEINADYRS